VKEWQVYLLECADRSLYCGITNDLSARIETHNTGRGAKYTRGRLPVTLVAQSREMTKSQALKCEIAIKQLPTQKKITAPAFQKMFE